MADVKAFQALRYDLAKAGRPEELITPPYDVINAQMQEDFYQANPYNIIRLEWGKTYSTDTDAENRYTRAAADFCAWQQQGVLKQDQRPAFYLYQQEFTVLGKTLVRTGFLATIRAEGYASGNVLPHEETLPKHKQDRFRLMQHTYANFSPILGLFAQKSLEIDHALAAQAKDKAPELDFCDADGVRHRLWKIDDPATVAKVEADLAGLKIYIADGHHRYETCSLFAEEARKQGKSDCDYMMIALINLYDSGLVVLPTHRLVKLMPGSEADLLAALTKVGFTIIKVGNGDKQAALEALLGRMEQGGKEIPSFGLYLADRFYLLQLLHKETALAKLPADKSEAYRNLDVTLLHSLILEPLFGIGPQELAAEGYIGYTRDNQEAVDAVDRGEYACSFLMNSTLVEELLAVAEAGEKMPQKSTFFYPKIIAGLAINKLQ